MQRIEKARKAQREISKYQPDPMRILYKSKQVRTIVLFFQKEVMQKATNASIASNALAFKV